MTSAIVRERRIWSGLVGSSRSSAAIIRRPPSAVLSQGMPTGGMAWLIGVACSQARQSFLNRCRFLSFVIMRICDESALDERP
jgi:hypothetical protein